MRTALFLLLATALMARGQVIVSRKVSELTRDTTPNAGWLLTIADPTGAAQPHAITTGDFKVWAGGSGGGGGGSGTVTSVGLSSTATWLTIGSSPVTGAGTITIAATGGLAANRVLATPSGATGALAPRALVVADIPDLSGTYSTPAAGLAALAAYTGTANISTVGTIASGAWHGTPVADSYVASASAWNAKLSPSGSGAALTGITATQVGADADGAATAAQAFSIQRANHTGTQTASTISDFTPTAAAAAPVQSVAGRAGTVTLTKADVGLSSVDNTSDAAKNAAGVTLTNHTISGAVNTLTNLPAAALTGTFGQIAASTSTDAHVLTQTNATIGFTSANVLTLRHTTADGAGALSFQDASGNERGASGYKNVGPANTYLDGSIYIAGGGYASDGTPLGVTKIVIGQEGSPGGNTPRLIFAADKSITFHTTGSAVHTKVGPDGGWMINPTGTGTTAKLDVVGPGAFGDDTAQANRNGDSSGRGILIDQSNGQVLRLVKTSVVGADLTLNGTAGTRRLDFVDKDNGSVVPLSLALTGTGNATVSGVMAAASFSGSGTGLTSIPAAQLTGTIAVANGGTGTTTPSLVAGTNVTITGTWPNQTVAASGGGGGGGSGAVVAVRSVSKTDTFTTTSSTWVDITGLSITYTPTSSANKVLVIANVYHDGTQICGIRLMRDSTPLSIGDAVGSNRTRTSGGTGFNVNYAMTTSVANCLDSPATTSAVTYKMQMTSTQGGAAYVNRQFADSDDAFVLRSASTITILEVTP